MATSNPKSMPSTQKKNSGSKDVSGANNTVMNSGFLNTALATNTNAGHSKSNQIQVIFNGRILTPQSLISRKYKGSADTAKKFSKGVNKSHSIHTIDESAPLADKVANLKQSSVSNLSKKQSEITGASMKMGSRAIAKSGIGALAAPALVEQSVEVTLSETTTLMHLSIPSLIVASDTRDVMAVDERNARYEAVVSAHKNADAFNSRPTQTKNLPLKNQNEMAAPNAFRDFASQAISFEILDATSNGGSAAGQNNADEISGKATSQSTGTGTDMEESDPAGLSAAVRKFVTETVGVSLVTPGCLLDTTTVVKAGNNDAQDKSSKAGTTVAKGSKKGKQTSGEQETTGNNSDNNVQKGGGSSNSGFLFSVKGGGGAGAASSNHGSGNNQNTSGAGGFDVVGAGTATGHIPSGSKANFSNTDIGAPDGSQLSDVAFTEEDSLQIIREAEIKRILSSPLLLKRLQLVERAVQQNANHRAQLDYRDLPDIAPLSLVSNMALNQDKGTRGKGDAISSLGFAGKGMGALSGGVQLKGKASLLGDSLGPKSAISSPAPGTAHSQSRHGKKPSTSMNINNLNAALNDAGMGLLDGEEGLGQAEKVRKLFSFSNPALVQNRSVTAMAWNAASSDLLAVGYGKTDVFSDAYKPGEKLDEEKLGGLVLFWSLRNPDYPEKILRTPQPVTALDFSKLNPMTLAVGLNNGDINIYNVKREGDKFEVPVESSAGMDNCHSDPVWQVKWIMKGVERIETLVSISSDGSILEWNMKKGLVMSTLMQLKKSGTGDGWISNSAAGLCFDFHPADPSTYVTGTEDGSIHRCSVSYNEQYLDTYAHHEGPTYRLRFSPRWPEVFMSCSADWSMNLYHFKSRQPLLSLRATGEDFPINDVAWCPGNSTVFGCVTMDSKLQLWDLSVSAIDPIISIDTTIETEVGDAAVVGEDGKDKNLESPPTTAPAANGAGTLFQTTNRYGVSDQAKEEDLLSPMNRLLKALNGDAKKKILTCLLFGEKSPIVVVGDNRGTVSLYRIFNPVTITHQGPLQQMNKLKHAVALQTDPVSAAMIQQSSTSSSSSTSQQLNGSELTGGNMM